MRSKSNPINIPVLVLDADAEEIGRKDGEGVAASFDGVADGVWKACDGDLPEWSGGRTGTA
ncbi:LacI family transcriptional regulator [Sesbania bispinosa]|nr:LacI family transcriptional regulator [Sesbania bispinosa]